MTVIRPNSISGINSITAQSTALNFYTAAGNNLPISAGSLNVGTGASISSPATNVLSLGTNNIEVARFDSSGNLGIGTNNPGYKLTVDQGTSDGNSFQFKNEEVGLFAGAWGTGATYDRQVTLSASRTDSGALPTLRIAGQGGLKFAVDLNTVRMEIDTSGRVTKPYTPHIFGSIGNNSTQTNSFASFMNVFSSTELTFSSSRVTVPVAGLYLITFTTISDSVTARRDANIYINGTSRLAMLTDDSSTGYKYRSGSLVAKLAASDYIQFYNQNWYDYLQTAYVDWRTASVTFLG